MKSSLRAYRSVSIPFKRENIYQQKMEWREWHTRLQYVSIPFKRENIYQLYLGSLTAATSISFQFPSNGKTYINLEPKHRMRQWSEFQFPSNGKTYINFISRLFRRFVSCQKVSIPFKRENIYQLCKDIFRCFAVLRVSIPFKRENIYQPSGHRPARSRFGGLRFNSLQTGKHISTLINQLRTVSHRGPILVSIPFKRESIYQQ